MKPAKPGICDHCGGELIQRSDDSLETAQGRLKVFHESTQPLIDFYTEKGVFDDEIALYNDFLRSKTE